jgi:hypothetical protein
MCDICVLQTYVYQKGTQILIPNTEMLILICFYRTSQFCTSERMLQLQTSEELSSSLIPSL